MQKLQLLAQRKNIDLLAIALCLLYERHTVGKKHSLIEKPTKTVLYAIWDLIQVDSCYSCEREILIHLCWEFISTIFFAQIKFEVKFYQIQHISETFHLKHTSECLYLVFNWHINRFHSYFFDLNMMGTLFSEKWPRNCQIFMFF